MLRLTSRTLTLIAGLGLVTAAACGIDNCKQAGWQCQ